MAVMKRVAASISLVLFHNSCCSGLSMAYSASGGNSSGKRVALVTGANKGIGKEIALRIGFEPGWTVVLAARDPRLGDNASSDLRHRSSSSENDGRGRGCSVSSVCRLDLTDGDSIRAAADSVRREHGRLDALVNNAAVCFNDPTLYGRVPHTLFEEQSGITVRTNFFGTLAVTEAFLPLLKETAAMNNDTDDSRTPSFRPRIVNVASAAGRLSIFPSKENRAAQFESDSLAVHDLKSLMEEFVSDAEAGIHLDRGWPNTAYGVSKAGIIALTKIMAKEHPEFVVSSVDPGYCRTDQNNNMGVVDPARGALTPFLLATLPDEQLGDGASGGHFFEEKEISWWYQ